MFCKKCGNQLPDDAKFCKKCGTPVNEENDKEEKLEKSPIKKRKKKWFFKSIVVLALIAIAYLILSNYYTVGIWIPNDVDEEMVSEEPEVDDEEFGSVYEVKNENVKLDEDTGFHYVDNIIIIFFEDSASEEEKAEVIETVSGTVVGQIPAINQYQIEVRACDYKELEALCEKVKVLDSVSNAHIDLAFKLTNNVVPKDPWDSEFFFLGEKWDTNNPDGSNWGVEAINAPEAWEYNSYFQNIKIGVVDSGFDTEHEDLKGRIKSISKNNNAGNHGTHVAGIIGAIPNNSCGITGLVWNSEIYTRDWELTDEQKNSGEYGEWNTTSKIYGGVSILITGYNVKLVNISSGLRLYKAQLDEKLIEEQGRYASEYMARLLEQGFDFIIVQSAGNGCNKCKQGCAEYDEECDECINSVFHESIDARYNGKFCSITDENCYTTENISVDDVRDRIIVVGAAQNDKNGQFTQAYFSNAGPNVDICAPGVDILSTVPGEYTYMSGTSMAAPMVTSVAAMVWSVDPELTGAEVKKIVCAEENTKYEVKDNTSPEHPLTDTYRMVNAQLAVEAAIAQKNAKDGNIEGNPLAQLEEIEAKPLHFSGFLVNPEDVVLKMFDALQEGDYETAAECLKPELEQQLDFLGGIASTIVGLFTGDYISWGQLALESAGAKDVEVIECSAYNRVYDSSIDFLTEYIPKLTWMKNFLCTEADVYVKYRYEYEGQYYIEEDTCHVKKYGSSGWRIEK